MIASVVAAALAMTVLSLNDFSSRTLVDKYRLLTDAFSIPGILYIMVGCLVYVSSQGFFDMISYGLSRLAKAMIPLTKKDMESFYDYKTRKNSKRFTGYAFLFYIGIALMVISGIFMILFYSMYK